MSCNLVSALTILLLASTSSNAFLDFDLTHEEANLEVPLYSGRSSDELIALCRLPDLTYDFESPDCIANTIALDKSDPRYIPLRDTRRALLKEAIFKAIGFKHRLSWPPYQFMAQLFLFFLALSCGIFLWIFGHFDMRSHHIQFFKDPTKGIPGNVYVHKAHNFYHHNLSPPDEDDPQIDEYLYDESEAWSTVDESDLERELPKLPLNQPGQPVVELTAEELEYIRKNAEFDEWMYPFEYKIDDKEEDDKEVAKFNARIEAANAVIIAAAAKKKQPYWRIAAMQQQQIMMDHVRDMPGMNMLDDSLFLPSFGGSDSSIGKRRAEARRKSLERNEILSDFYKDLVK